MALMKIESRLKILLAFIIMIFVIISFRLGYLQILQNKEFQRLSEGNRIRLITQRAPRGQMFDSDNEPIVATRYAYTVSLVPMEIKNMEAVIEELSPLLNMKPENIRQKVDDAQEDKLPSYYPIRIKTDISDETLVKIEEKSLELPGVTIEEQPVRDYIQGDFASHLIGRLGEISDKELKVMKKDGYKMTDIIGQKGLEELYDKIIRGEDGGQQVEVDNRGRPVKVLGQKNPIPGNDLYLTIDKAVQMAAEKSMQETMKHVQKNGFPNAQAAAAIAINPKNGKILAMSSKPSFDPNLFVGGISREKWDELTKGEWAEEWKPMKNKVTRKGYAPGSTFKPLMGIAALEERQVTPDETVTCTGRYWLWHKPHCWKTSGHGKVNIYKALQQSCNVFFYEMGNRLGIDVISKYARMFGLGEKTGLVLTPGEESGTLPTREWKQKDRDEPWYPGDTLNIAIGQGFNSYTPIQIVNYIATIANGGTLYRPYVVDKIVKPGGELVKQYEPQIRRQLPIKKENFEIIKEGMARVTQPGGTAYNYFKDFPIPVGGKTGTAEKTGKDNDGWFVCFAPVDDPQIAIAVVVEQGGHGGSAAAPIARAMLDAFFGIEKQEEQTVESPQTLPHQPQPAPVHNEASQPPLPSESIESEVESGENQQPMMPDQSNGSDKDTNLPIVETGG